MQLAMDVEEVKTFFTLSFSHEIRKKKSPTIETYDANVCPIYKYKSNVYNCYESE